MSIDPLADTSLHFAKKLHGETWELLEMSKRSKDEDERMVHVAHASCYHWLHVGTGLNQQRGEWLIARVYSVLGLAESALRHATRCLELTEEHAELMHDFDRAYAYEGMARALAVAGNRTDAVRYLQLAEEGGRTILDAEDQEYFLTDLRAREWHGMR